MCYAGTDERGVENMGLTNSLLSAATEHPAFSAESCLNRRQRRFVCTLCHDVCPRGAFSLEAGKTIQWERCVDCELCTALCPSRCFLPAPGVRKSYAEDPDLSRPVSVGCREEESLPTLRVRCLAGAPWELLALIAMRTELVLCIRACRDCAHPDWAARTAEQLALLRGFLGEERWQSRVRLIERQDGELPAAEESKEPEREMTRREIFGGLKKRAAKGLYKAAAQRLPILAGEEADGMQYRRMLARAAAEEQAQTAEGEDAPRYGVRLPRFNVSCYGCGICEKLCPRKAIEIGPEEDGKRLLFVTPWKCTACALCQKACPQGGITEMHTVQVPRLTKLALVRIQSGSCERCGMAIPAGSDPPLCPSCAAKAKRGR